MSIKDFQIEDKFVKKEKPSHWASDLGFGFIPDENNKTGFCELAEYKKETQKKISIVIYCPYFGLNADPETGEEIDPSKFKGSLISSDKNNRI